MPMAAMLAANARMSAVVCGTLRTFLGDFLSRSSGTNRMFLLTSLAIRLLMVSLLWLRGSAQSPRMNPCPSARPGEGEQEENRRGSLSAQSGSDPRASGGAKIGGDRFSSCWGCQGRALAPPTSNKEIVAERHAILAATIVTRTGGDANAAAPVAARLERDRAKRGAASTADVAMP